MKRAKWQDFTIEEIQQMVQESFSFSGLMQKMGYAYGSNGAQPTIKKLLEDNNISYEHFKGHAWNKKEIPISDKNEFGVDNKRIIKETILKERKHQCENCGLEIWLNQPIPLELHHKDGDPYNNIRSNLILLCPNCHAFTDNWRGRHNKNNISDEEFLYALQTTSSICAACRKLGITPNENNYKRARYLLQKNK